MESSVRETEKRYGARAMTMAIIVAAIFILAGHKPIGKGVILGSLFSVVNFVLIGETLPMRHGKSQGKTFFLALSSIFFRYILIAVPLVLGIKLEQFDLLGTVFGIFSVQLMILSEHIFNVIGLRGSQK